MTGGAVFDSTRAYRYRLWREWDAALPTVAFVMLNPSTAGATNDDRTISRCLGFARAWGFGRLEVVNRFAYRATSPRELFAAADPVGRENEDHLREVLHEADLVVAAWGNHARRLPPPKFDRDLACLGLTKLGEPRHPLYVPSGRQPQPLAPRDRDEFPPSLGVRTRRR